MIDDFQNILFISTITELVKPIRDILTVKGDYNSWLGLKNEPISSFTIKTLPVLHSGLRRCDWLNFFFGCPFYEQKKMIKIYLKWKNIYVKGLDNVSVPQTVKRILLPLHQVIVRKLLYRDFFRSIFISCVPDSYTKCYQYRICYINNPKPDVVTK